MGVGDVVYERLHGAVDCGEVQDLVAVSPKEAAENGVDSRGGVGDDDKIIGVGGEKRSDSGADGV